MSLVSESTTSSMRSSRSWDRRKITALPLLVVLLVSLACGRNSQGAAATVGSTRWSQDALTIEVAEPSVFPGGALVVGVGPGDTRLMLWEPTNDELKEVGTWGATGHWLHRVAADFDDETLVGSMGLSGDEWSLWAGKPDAQVLLSHTAAGFAFDPNDPTRIAWLDVRARPPELIVNDLSAMGVAQRVSISGVEWLAGWTDAGIAMTGRDGSSVLTPEGDVQRLDITLAAWSDEGTGVAIVDNSVQFVDVDLSSHALELPELDDESVPLSASWLPDRNRFVVSSFIVSPEGTTSTLRLITPNGRSGASITFDGWKAGYAVEWGQWLAVSGGSGKDDGNWLRLWNPDDDTIVSVLSSDQITPIGQL